MNLYAGIGGNRKLWEDVEVTAVELDPKIAEIYQDFFPKDQVIVADAHQYLLEHYDEDWDFVWASPPCPSHSRIRKVTSDIDKDAHGFNKPIYPDLKLYEEVLFLQGYAKCKWVIENVISWYDPLILPIIYKQHYYWSNFQFTGKKYAQRNHYGNSKTLGETKGFDISKYKTGKIDKRKILRNCVEPEAGLYIFNCAFKHKQQTLKIGVD